MFIRIEAVIEIDEDVWYSHNDEEELEWFTSMLNSKRDSMVVLHSNEVGDVIGETFDFNWEIIKSE
jgi:hypothetical protein